MSSKPLPTIIDDRDSIRSLPLYEPTLKKPFREFTKHPVFYFPDGNIVLATSDMYLFKLYGGQLARHSEVFADMLAMPQPTDTEDVMDDGCPVVTLQDAAEDLASLFSLLWDLRPQNPDFQTIARALRISNKYFFNSIRDWCIARLEDTLPSSYEDFKKDAGLYQYFKTDCLPQDVIQLAYDCELYSLLPLAFYKLSIHAWTIQQPKVSQKWIGSLTTDILTRLLLGRERMQDVWLEFIMMEPTMGWDHGSEVKPPCLPSSKSTCHSGLLFHNHIGETLSVGLKSPVEAIRSFRAQVESKLCARCLAVLDKNIDAFGRHIYEELPNIFDLPTPIDV